MTMNKLILGVTIRTWWTLVIAVAVTSCGTWAAVDHANAIAARQQRHTNQQFREALILANHKFQQSIRISSKQSTYSINKSACGFRELVKKTRQRARATLEDPKASPAAKAAARQTLGDIASFLETQVTSPPDFDCARLPKKPPK